MHTSRPVRTAALIAVATATLAACSTADADTAASSAASSETSTGAEVTVATALGDATVTTEPARVVVFEHGILDTLDALGLGDAVVMIPHQAIPSYLSSYETSTENGGTLFEPDYEAINAADPDLIIVGGRSASTYDQMAEIAPTIDLTFGSGTDAFVESLERNTLTIGQIFDVEAEAQAALDDLATQAEEIASSAADIGPGLVLLTTGGQVNAYGPSDEGRFDFVYGLLGLAAATDQGTIDSHGDSVSYEFLAEVDPSWLIVLDRDAAIGAEGESAMELLDNDLVNSTTAAQEDRITYADSGSWYLALGGLTATSTVYDEVQSLVG